MILSRVKPAIGPTFSEQHGSGKVIPTLDAFLAKRDYTGAISMLEFEQSIGKGTEMTDRWIGYCAFHLGDYKQAMTIFKTLLEGGNAPADTVVNLACCYFFLGMYNESEKVLENAPSCRLKTRLQFHLSHKRGDETKLMANHEKLENVTEDMLSLAAVHFLRSHYQEAIDIYKRILLDNRKLFLSSKDDELEFVETLSKGTEYLALNVYVALCYYKLDYYDVSQEVLAVYLQKYGDSAIAINLKACNHYKLYNGKAAETEIKSLLGEYSESYELIKSLEPSVPQEYILKAIVNVVIGQESGSREHLKVAQQYFQLVGNSVSECDTIPGRQCMASAFFLQRQFEDVHVYLSTIKSYFFNDDSFNFNYAQSKTALGNYREAEETFLNIQSEKIQNDYIYLSHLARCYVMVGKAQEAWELYLKMETSAESFSLLQLLANDCYRMGQFYHAAKAFDLLERLDPSPEHWEGKRGAAVGAFQLIVAGKQPSDLLPDVIQLLRNSTNPQVEGIISVMKRWAKENRINVASTSKDLW